MRYKAVVMYDGTMFHGFQSQDNLRTVQEEIEKVLKIITKKETRMQTSLYRFTNRKNTKRFVWRTKRRVFWRIFGKLR